MHITLRQLQVFAAIARQENMTFAAQTLYLSQSACSMALTSLEHQLGNSLFNRHGKRLTLNEYGRFLLPKAIDILNQMKEFESFTAENSGIALTGHLIVGASSTIGNYLLPQIIGRFIAQYPQTKISLRVSNTEQVINQLLTYEIDLGIIEGTCYADELTSKPWGKDELVIIVAPKHPLAKQKNLTLTDIKNDRWILRESGSGTRERFETALGGHIKPFLELGHTEAIKNAVQHGLGISCLSRVTVADALKSGQLIELKIPGLKLKRNFYYLLHKEKKLTDLLKAFVQSKCG